MNIPQKNLLEDVCKKIITVHKNYTSIEETVMEAIKPYLLTILKNEISLGMMVSILME